MSRYGLSVKPKPPTKDVFQFEENSDGNIVFQPSMSARSQIANGHPLEHVLKQQSHQDAIDKSAMLRAFGSAGAMIHAMELRATSSVGHLPFLPSSNFQRDVLTGRDEEMDYQDVFGVNPSSSERQVHPHVVMNSVKFRDMVSDSPC